MRKTILVLLCLAFLASSALSETAQLALPLAFEKNVGQASPDALFLARSAEGKIFFEKQSIRGRFGMGESAVELRMSFSGANAGPSLALEEPTRGIANYYAGADRRQWLERIPLFHRLRYREIYPGTDLVFHGTAGRLEYDFELAPHADPARISLDFPGVDNLSTEPNGDLLLDVAGKHVRMLAPKAYQGQSPVSAQYRILADGHVSFALGAYDPSQPLIIDPVVAYTTIIGVDNSTTVTALTVDDSGNVFVAGRTYARDYPATTGTADPINGASYLTKLDPTGSQILFSTELQAGNPAVITLGPNGSIFMAGIAKTGFPLTSTAIATCDPALCNAGFAAKFDSSGQIVYSTLLASGQVLPKGLVVDSSGSAYITGQASDASLPLVNPYPQMYVSGVCTTCRGAFFLKLNAAGNAYEFSSYFSASTASAGKAIALDASGNIYLAGSGSVPLLNPLQTSTGGTYLAKLSPDGQTLLFSTLFGGLIGALDAEDIAGLSVDTDGTVYLVGNTNTTNFPYALNAFRLPTISTSYGGTHVFAAAFKPDLSGLKYSTFIAEGWANVMLLRNHQIYIAGSFYRPIPLKDAVVSDLVNGGFVLALDSTGNLAQSTQFSGRNKQQVPTALAVDSAGNIYVAGTPESAYSGFSNDDWLDPVNVGTGVAYTNQQLMGTSTHFIHYATFIAKIAPANQPQISLSVYQPYLILRNAGSADLHIQNISLANGLTRQWGNCGKTIPAGRSCILTVTGDTGYTAVGGTVTITSDAVPNSQTFNPIASRDGPVKAAPVMWIVPDVLDFGPRMAGTHSDAKPVQLWNVGAFPLTLTGFSPSSATVTQSNDCPATLGPGSFCTLQVNLVPNANDSLAQLNISSQEAGNISASVQSTPSAAPLLLSATDLNFGGQRVGRAAFVRTVAITNASDITMDAPSITLDPGSPFQIAGTTCNAALAPLQTCAAAFAFTPTANGDNTAFATVATGGSSQQVRMFGTGFVDSTVAIAPLQLSFHDSIIGMPTYSQDVTLTNNGSAPVNVTDIQFSLPDYSQTNTCQGPLQPGGTCIVTVTVQTQEIGARNATLTITFDHALTQAISLTTNSITPLVSRVKALDFGNTTPVDSDSNPMTMDLGNGLVSQGLSQQPYTITVTGDFRVDMRSCPNPMPHQYGCVFWVYFHPTTPGTHQGTLTVSFPQTTATLVVPLTGTTGTGITISTVSLTFPLTMATFQSSAQTVDIKNPQATALTIPPPVLSGDSPGDFQVSFACGTMAPGATCQVPIVFAPAAPGTRTATLTFQNGGNPPVSIPISLSGTASPLPGLAVDTAGYNFGSADLGSSATFNIKVTNQGPRPVALPPLTIGGQHASDFSATPEAACSSLAPNGSCQIKVVFKPSSSGARYGNLSLASLSSDSHLITIAFVGSGSDFAFSTTNSTFTRTIAAGNTATYDIWAQADPGYSSAVTVTCAANGASYGPCTVTPSTLSLSGGSQKFTATIAPVAQASLGPHRSASWWILACTALLPLGFVARGKRAASMMVVTLAIAGFISCGGGGGGTPGTPANPPGTTTSTYSYTLTLTGAGNTARTQTLTLMVQK